MSARHKAEHPLCEPCERKGILRPVYITHHKVPHNGDPALFWDYNNFESNCLECHNKFHSKERWGGG